MRYAKVVRWLGQRDSFRCGPVALVNVIKWAGIKEFEGHQVNERLAKGYLTDKCEAARDGTTTEAFEKVLYAIPGLSIAKFSPAWSVNIKFWLTLGYVVILSSEWWDSGEREYLPHYCLLIDTTHGGAFYTVINGYEKPVVNQLSRGRLARMLKKPDTEVYILWKEKKDDRS
jgi:hypothetical protein